MSKYTWRKHDVEELHNSDDLQEISKLAHLAVLRLRDALWRRNGNSIKAGAIPTSILYERSEWESVMHEVMPFFDFDEIGIFCADILEQVSHAEGVRQAKSRAGKTSAQVRNQHMLNTCSTDVQHMSQHNPTAVQQRRGEEIREEEKKGDEKKVAKRSVKPTLDEAQEYMTSIGIHDPNGEGVKFFDYYQSNGWKVGKSPMKDWQAACRNWKRNLESRKQVSYTPRDFTLDGL
jgi:hypothetical protein